MVCNDKSKSKVAGFSISSKTKQFQANYLYLAAHFLKKPIMDWVFTCEYFISLLKCHNWQPAECLPPRDGWQGESCPKNADTDIRA